MIAVAIQFRLTHTLNDSATLLAERTRALEGTAGLVSCCLHYPARADGPYQLVTCWDSLDALDRWLHTPSRCAACPGCPALPATAQVVALDIVVVVAPPSVDPPLIAARLRLGTPGGWG